jgi:hypothetical protein
MVASTWVALGRQQRNTRHHSLATPARLGTWQRECSPAPPRISRAASPASECVCVTEQNPFFFLFFGTLCAPNATDLSWMVRPFRTVKYVAAPGWWRDILAAFRRAQGPSVRRGPSCCRFQQLCYVLPPRKKM